MTPQQVHLYCSSGTEIQLNWKFSITRFDFSSSLKVNRKHCYVSSGGMRRALVSYKYFSVSTFIIKTQYYVHEQHINTINVLSIITNNIHSILLNYTTQIKYNIVYTLQKYNSLLRTQWHTITIKINTRNGRIN